MKPIKHHEEMEVRAITMEMRAAADSRTIEGYAALFNSPTDMGWYNEVIAAGAFDEANMDDVRCLFNHDPNLIYARTASGTLSLSIDDKGLKYSFEMPETTAGNDLLEMIRRGDISQSSFAFRVKERSWEWNEEEPDVRTILKIETVYDVSPVTYPAYNDTDVALRCKQIATGEERSEQQHEPLHSESFADDVEFLNKRLSAV